MSGDKTYIRHDDQLLSVPKRVPESVESETLEKIVEEGSVVKPKKLMVLPKHLKNFVRFN